MAERWSSNRPEARAPLALLAMGILAGCATAPPPPQCDAPRHERLVATIPLGADAVLALIGPVRLTDEGVECLALLGSKPMQYELGRRLERSDPERAQRLFAAAATSVAPTTAIYAPGVCVGCPGRVLLIPNAAASPGLPEAELALAVMHVEGRAVPADPRRGFRTIDRLAKRGYPPAAALQAQLRARRS
jgi:TPR repeat protein